MYGPRYESLSGLFSTYFYPFAGAPAAAAVAAVDFLVELQVLWQDEANSTCCLRRHMFVHSSLLLLLRMSCGYSTRFIYLRFLLCNLTHLSKRLHHALQLLLPAGCECLSLCVCAINKVKMSSLCLLKMSSNSALAKAGAIFL